MRQLVLHPFSCCRIVELHRLFRWLSVRLVQVRLVLFSLQAALPLVVPRSRTQGSSQSISSDHWLHLLLLRTLADLCVKDVSTALVNDVEALGAVQNLRDFLDSILV